MRALDVGLGSGTGLGEAKPSWLPVRILRWDQSCAASFSRRVSLDLKVKPCLHALTAEDPMTMHLPMTLAAMSEDNHFNGIDGEG